MYSPYLLDINAGVNGIGVVITHTRAIHMFIVWGLFLTAVTPFLLATFWQTTVQRDWAAQTLTAGLRSHSPRGCYGRSPTCPATAASKR